MRLTKTLGLIPLLVACTRSGAPSGPAPSAEPPGTPPAPAERPAETYSEPQLRDLLAASEISEISRFDREQAARLFRSVERLGQDDEPSSIRTLFATLLAAHSDLHLQRAALFSLVRRAPASLTLATELLERPVPELSQFVHFEAEVSEAMRRSYERSLAAAVLGLSGISAARAPLARALEGAQDTSERALFVLSLVRLARHGQVEALLGEELERTPLQAEVAPALASGLVQLVPALEDLLLPCNFEIARLGAPVLVVEALASAADDQAVETLAPALIERAEHVAADNPEAGTILLRSAAALASRPVFALLRKELHRNALATQKEWLDTWADELGAAFERCGDELSCHLKRLDAPDIDLSHVKSAQLVAARTPLDQGPALLDQMERMARPYWLAVALDQRLPHPEPEQRERVRKLSTGGPEDAGLYVPHSVCSRIDSPLEELAIRLDVRARGPDVAPAR